MHRISYETHTADLRMRIAASEVGGLFPAALEGMSELVEPGICGRSGPGAGESVFPLREEVDLRAPDGTVLLIDFLSHVLTLSHLRRALFCHVDITGLGAPEMGASEPGGEAFLQGSIRGRSAHSWQRDIKAVSYHEADIRRGRDGWWETMVVFDI